MPKITVVVPTYNVEAYIKKCLDSLVAQTSHDFIALIINDGSPANEQTIIELYVQTYPYIKSIVKQNGGYGSVLNLALSIIDTPYFLICDPDDYLREDAIESLIGLMENNNVDLVVGAKQLVYSDNQETKYDPSYNPDYAQLKHLEIYTKGEQAFDQLFFMEPSPHAKLYKTELIKSIHFPEKVSYTDNLLFYIGLLNSKKVIYTKETYSFYLINREGNTRTDLRPAVMDHWVTVIGTILEQSKNIPSIPDMFYYRMFESFKFVFNKIDFIKADPGVLRQKLFSTEKLLKMLLPYRNKIIPIYHRLSQAQGKERNHDLLLLDSNKSSYFFVKLAEKKLVRLAHGADSGIKGKLKVSIQSSPTLSKVYDIYHKHAKYFYARKNPKVTLHPSITMKIIDPQGQTFFGYYNQSPYRNGHYVYHRIKSDSLSLKQTVEICLDGNPISSSSAWNWQQGSMLQWLDDDHIIHNVFENGNYRSKIVDIKTKKSKLIDFPIYATSKDGSFGLSLNFKRLAKYRPDYGYFNVPYDTVLPYDPNDGIYRVDFETNSHERLISFKELVSFETQVTMSDAAHKVNHIDISPDGKRFIFLHRWFKDKKKYTRLVLCEIDSLKMKALSDSDMVSHCYWKNDQSIIGYLRDQSFGDRYYLLENNARKVVFKDLLTDDGHPSFSRDERSFITDTYPDYTCTQKLFFSKTPFNQIIELGRFYSGRRFLGPNRCDLHPRFSDGKSEITLDTVYAGKRQLVSVDVSEIVGEIK